jgi:hypothetical protein
MGDMMGDLPLTETAHRARHIELHQALDELLADYIGHHPLQSNFLGMPLRALLEWSFRQTQQPDAL